MLESFSEDGFVEGEIDARAAIFGRPALSTARRGEPLNGGAQTERLLNIAVGKLSKVFGAEDALKAVEKGAAARVGAVGITDGKEKAIDADHLQRAAQGWMARRKDSVTKGSSRAMVRMLDRTIPARGGFPQPVTERGILHVSIRNFSCAHGYGFCKSADKHVKQERLL